MVEKTNIEIIRDVFVLEFELEAELIVPESTLYEDLDFDSLDAVDMIVVMEQAFGVKLKDEKIVRSIRTIQDLADFITTLQSESLVNA